MFAQRGNGVYWIWRLAILLYSVRRVGAELLSNIWSQERKIDSIPLFTPSLFFQLPSIPLSRSLSPIQAGSLCLWPFLLYISYLYWLFFYINIILDLKKSLSTIVLTSPGGGFYKFPLICNSSIIFPLSVAMSTWYRSPLEKREPAVTSH